MTLEGAQFICLDEAGNRGTIVKAKGRKFTVGYYTSCDLAIDDERAKGVHCTIECDAFGRITISNSSVEHPIAINGEEVKNKRILFNKTTIKILDKSYLWEFATKNAKEFEDVHSGNVSTPQKQIGIPQQSAFSCPDAKHTQKAEPRFTVHNFAYCIQSDEEGNTSRESNENDNSITAAEEDPDVSVKSETKDEEEVAAEQRSRQVTPEPTECKEEHSVETPKMNLINSTNNKENTSSTHKKNRLQLTLCHQSDVVITSFSPRETGVKAEKSFTAILKPKVLVTRAPNTPKSVYSTPISVLGDDEDDDVDASRNVINFHTPSTSRKGAAATNTASKCLKNSSMHLVDFTTPNKLAPASPYLKSALKASAKKLPMTPSAAKASKDKVPVGEQLGVSDLPITPVVSDDQKNYSETPNSVQSVISVDSTDTSSVIELLSDESTPGTNAHIVLKTPGKCATGKIQATTPMRTPQSLMKRAILTSTKKQATTPQRSEGGPVTPRREPINRIPLRCSIGSLKSPVTPNHPTNRDVQLSRRLSMSTPSRKSLAAPRSESTPLTKTNAPTTTPSSSRRSSLIPMSASRAQTSTPYGASNRKHAACKTSPLKRVRKSIGGVPLSSHISKVRRSIIAAAPSQYTSIKEKSPQQAMSDRLVLRARKSVCVTPIVARAISMVEAAKTPSAGILKKQTQSARKSLAARPVLFADRRKQRDNDELAELSRTFVVDSDEDETQEVDKQKGDSGDKRKKAEETKRKDATFSPEKEKALNATFSPEKDPHRDAVPKSLEIPLDVEEVAHKVVDDEPPEHDSLGKDDGKPANVTKQDFPHEATSTNKTETKSAQSNASEESFAEIIAVSSQEELNEINKTSCEIVTQIKETDEDENTSAEHHTDAETGFGEESLIEKSVTGSNSTTIEPQIINGGNVSSIGEVTNDKDTIEVTEADSSLKEEPSISDDKNETLDILEKTSSAIIEKQTSFVYKPICEDITLESSQLEKDAKEIADESKKHLAERMNESLLEKDLTQTVDEQACAAVQSTEVSGDEKDVQEVLNASQKEQSIIASGSEMEDKYVKEISDPIPVEITSSQEEESIIISEDEHNVDEMSEATPEIIVVKSSLEEPSSVVSVNDNADNNVEEISETTEILANPEEIKSSQAEQSTVVSVDDNADIKDTSISEATDSLAKPEENKSSQAEQITVVSEDENDVEEIPEATQVVERLTCLDQEEPDNENNSSNDGKDKHHESENTDRSKPEAITEDIADSSVRGLAEDAAISESLMEDVQSTSKLLEEIEDVLNKSDEIKLKHLENRDHDSESIRTLTEENESEKLTEDSNLDYQPSEGDIENSASGKIENVDSENKLNAADNNREELETSIIGGENDGEVVTEEQDKAIEGTSTESKPLNGKNSDATSATASQQTASPISSSLKDENVCAPKSKLIENLTSTGTPKRRSRRTSMLAETTSDDTKENIDVSLESVAKKLIDSEMDGALTPKRSSRRKSSSSMETEALLRPLPTFTPRRSARRASMSIETSNASTPTSKKTRRASLSAVSEAPLTPKRITRRRSSISLDTDEAVKVVQDSTNPSGDAEGVAEINEDMGAIIEEEDEDEGEAEAEEAETKMPHHQHNITKVVLLEENEAMELVNEGDAVKVVIEENLCEIVSEPPSATSEQNAEMLREAITTTVHDLTQGDEGDVGGVVETVHDLTQDEEEETDDMAVASESIQDLTEDEKNMVSVQDINQDEESICKVIGDSVQDLTQDEENINASSAVQDLTLDEENVEQGLCGDEKDNAVQDLTQGLSNIEDEKLDNVAVQDLTKNNESMSKIAYESVQDLTQDEESICELVSEDLTNDEVDKANLVQSTNTVEDVVEEEMQTLVVSDDESIYEANTNEGTQTPKAKKFVRIAADSPKTPVMAGMRELLKTPKPEQSTPKFVGIRHLVRTPKTKPAETEEEEAEKLQDMRKLVTTPKTTDSALNTAEDIDLEVTSSDFRGEKELLKTPKRCSTPHLRGLRELTQTPKRTSSPALGGIKELLDTPVQEQQPEIEDMVGSPPVSSSKAEEKDVQDVHELQKTPKSSAATPRFKGMRELMQTPKVISTPVLSGVKELLDTPVQEKEPEEIEIDEEVEAATSSKDVEGDIMDAKELQKTPKTSAATPRFKGMRELMQTPKVISTPVLSGVKELMDTPVQEKETEDIEINEEVETTPTTSSKNVEEDIKNSKELQKTPKSCATPRFKGMRELMQTPKVIATPILSGVKELLDTPVQEKETEDVEINEKNVEEDSTELQKTPKTSAATPRFKGMRELMQTPKVISTPVLSGVKELMDTPVQDKETVVVEINEEVEATTSSKDVEGDIMDAKELQKTPKTSAATPRFKGMRELMQTPKVISTPVLSGVKELLDTPVQEKETEDIEINEKNVEEDSTELQKTPKTSAATPRFKGMRELMQTPKVISTPVLSGVKELMDTPVQDKETVVVEINEEVEATTSSKDVEGDIMDAKELQKTPKSSEATPRFKGMRELMQTPGVKELLDTPVQETKVIEIDEEDVESKDLRGVKELLKTPKSSATPRFKGMRELMQTPKSSSTPVLVGVKDLLVTPTQEQQTEGEDVEIYNLEVDGPTTSSKDPQNELRRTKGLLKTPKGCSTPRFKGMRELMQTPKVTSTPALSGLKELMDTPKQKLDEDGDFDKFLKTPTAKNIMIPTLPSSAIIEKNEDSVEMIHSTEYDLNDSHDDGSTHLQELFKTPVASRFVERITASFYGEEGEEDETSVNVDRSNKSVNENTDTHTPLRTVLQRKSLALKTPQFQSPFSAADVLSDLSKTDVEEWVGQVVDPLQQTINIDDEDDIEEVKETNDNLDSSVVNLDDSLIIKDDTHSESLSMVPETCSKVYLVDKSVSVTNTSEAMINLSSLGGSATSKDPLEGATTSKLKQMERRPYTPTDAADISGINLLDQTGESALDESLVVSDDDEDANQTLNQSSQPQEVQSEPLGEDDDNDLRESLLLSDSDEPEKDTSGKSPEKPMPLNETWDNVSKSTDNELALANDRQTSKASENENIENDTAHVLVDASSTKNEEVESVGTELALPNEGLISEASQKENIENDTSLALEDASSAKNEEDEDNLIAETTSEKKNIESETSHAEADNENSDIENEDIELSERSPALDTSSAKNEEAEDVQENLTTEKPDTEDEKTTLEKAHNSECEDIFLDDSLEETSAQDTNKAKTQAPEKSDAKQNDNQDNEVIELTSDESNDCKVIDNDAAEKMSGKETSNHISMHECEDIFMDDSSVSEVSASQKESEDGIATVTVESSSEDGNENSKVAEDDIHNKTKQAHEEENNKDSSSSSNKGETNATSVEIQETITVSYSTEETVKDNENKNEEPVEDSLPVTEEILQINKEEEHENDTVVEHPGSDSGKQQNADIISIDDSDSCEEFSQTTTEGIEPSGEIEDSNENELQTTSHGIEPNDASGEQENTCEEQCLDDIESSIQEIEQPSTVVSMSAITSEEDSMVPDATKSVDSLEKPKKSETIDSTSAIVEEIPVLEDESKIVSTDTSGDAEEKRSLVNVVSGSFVTEGDSERPILETYVLDDLPKAEANESPEENEVMPQDTNDSVVDDESKVDELPQVTPESENIESLDMAEPLQEESNVEVTALNEVSKEEPTTSVPEITHETETTDEKVILEECEESISNTKASAGTTQLPSTINEVPDEDAEALESVSKEEPTTSVQETTKPPQETETTVKKVILEESVSILTPAVGKQQDTPNTMKDNLSESVQTVEISTKADESQSEECENESHKYTADVQSDKKENTIEIETEFQKDITEHDRTEPTVAKSSSEAIDEPTQTDENATESVKSSSETIDEPPQTDENATERDITAQTTPSEVTSSCSTSETVKTYDIEVKITDSPEYVEEISEMEEQRHQGKSSKRSRKGSQSSLCSNDSASELPKPRRVRRISKTEEEEVSKTEATAVELQAIAESEEEHVVAKDIEIVPEDSEVCKDHTTASTGQEQLSHTEVNDIEEVVLKKSEVILETVEPKGNNKAADYTSDDGVSKDIAPENYVDEKNEKDVVPEEPLPVQPPNMEEDNETVMLTENVEVQPQDIEETTEPPQKRVRRKASQNSVHEDDPNNKKIRRVDRRKLNQDQDEVEVGLDKMEENRETSTTSSSSSSGSIAEGEKVNESEEIAKLRQSASQQDVKENKTAVRRNRRKASNDSVHSEDDERTTVTRKGGRRKPDTTKDDAAGLEKIVEIEETPVKDQKSANIQEELVTKVSDNVEVAEAPKEDDTQVKDSTHVAAKTHISSTEVAVVDKNQIKSTEEEKPPMNKDLESVEAPSEVEKHQQDTKVVKGRVNKRGHRKTSQQSTSEAASAEVSHLDKIEEKPIEEIQSSGTADLQEEPLNKETNVSEAIPKEADERHPGTEVVKGRVNKRVRRKASQEESTHEAAKTPVTPPAKETDLDKIEEQPTTNSELAGVPDPSASKNKESSDISEAPKEIEAQPADTEVAKVRANKRGRRKASQEEDSTLEAAKPHSASANVADQQKIEKSEEKHTSQAFDLHEPSVTLNIESDILEAAKENEDQQQHETEMKGRVNKRGRRKASQDSTLEEGSSSVHARKCSRRRGAQLTEEEQQPSLDVVDENEELEATPSADEQKVPMKTSDVEEVQNAETDGRIKDSEDTKEPVNKRGRHKATQVVVHEEETSSSTRPIKRGGRRKAEIVAVEKTETELPTSSEISTEELKKDNISDVNESEQKIVEKTELSPQDSNESVSKHNRRKATKDSAHDDAAHTEHTRKGGRRMAQVAANDGANSSASQPLQDKEEQDKKSDIKQSEQQVANKAAEPVAVRSRRKASQDNSHEADKAVKQHTRRVRHLSTKDDDTTADKKEAKEADSAPTALPTLKEDSDESSLKDVEATHKDEDHHNASKTPVEPETTVVADEITSLEKETEKGKEVIEISEDESTGDKRSEEQHDDKSRKTTRRRGAAAQKQDTDHHDKKPAPVRSRRGRKAHDVDEESPQQTEKDTHLKPDAESENKSEDLEHQASPEKSKTTRGAARNNRKKHDDHHEVEHGHEETKAGTTRGSARNVRKKHDDDHDHHEDEHGHEETKAGTTRVSARNVRKKHDDDHHEDEHGHEETEAGTTLGSARNLRKKHDDDHDHHEDEHGHEETEAGTTLGSARNLRKKQDDDHDHHEDEQVHEEKKAATRRKAPASRKRAATRKKDNHEEGSHEVHEVDISEVEIPADVNTTEETTKGRGRRKKDEHKEVPVTAIEELPEHSATASHSVETKTRSRKRKESHTEHEEQPHAKVISPETPQRVLASNEESNQTPESERRARNVPQRRAAIVYHNYDETSDSEKPEKKKKKTDSPRKSLEPANPVNEDAIKPAESLLDVSPTLLTPSTTARGRTRKPTARVQKFLEEERAKAESPRKRGGLADVSVADTPTKSQPGKRGGKSALADTQSVGTPQTSKRLRGKVVTESVDNHEKPQSDSHNIIDITVPEHTTPPPATTTSRGRKGARKAKANVHTGDDDATDEPPAKKSPQQLSAEKEEVVTETIPLNVEDATPTRTTGRRNAAAAAKARIEEDALAAADDHPKKSRAKRVPAKVAVSPVKREHTLESASNVDGTEDLQAAEESHAQEEPKTATKRAPRKAAAATDSPAVPAKRSRKAKATTAETDELEVDEPKTSRAAARGRKNVHFAPADQKTATSATQPSVEPPPTELPQAVEEPPAATTKRATRTRRK